MNLKYENFLRELSSHYASRSGALSAGIECIGYHFSIPGVTITDREAFQKYLTARAKEIDSRYNEELQKITLQS
jgi:hypothetical protein